MAGHSVKRERDNRAANQQEIQSAPNRVKKEPDVIAISSSPSPLRSLSPPASSPPPLSRLPSKDDSEWLPKQSDQERSLDEEYLEDDLSNESQSVHDSVQCALNKKLNGGRAYPKKCRMLL